MKTRQLLKTLLVVCLSVLVTIFVYSRVTAVPKNDTDITRSVQDANTAPAVLTSFQASTGPVDLTYAAENTVHAVVHVRIRSTVSMGDEYDNPLFQFFYGNNAKQQPQKVTGFGSGVIISPDGYIITNNHVVENADSIQVTLYNNKTYNAKIIGKDPDTDIALIKVNAQNLPVIRYGDSDKLKIGEWVLAVGNPFNLTSTVTAGIISAKGRSIDLDGSYKIESYIQTDAALNMGNSGGALVNTNAELVGITAAIISPTGTYSGNSFAIPSNIVKKVVGDLRQYGKVQRAMLGVKVQTVTSDIASQEKLNDVSGAYLASVNQGSAAEEAGLKTKDVIVRIDNTPIQTPSDLQATISEHRPGDKIDVTYFRNGKDHTASLVLKNTEGTTAVMLKSTGEMALGCKVVPLTSNDKNRFNLDSGVKVADVGQGKLKDIGIRKGTLITSINGKNVNNASEIRDATTDGENLLAIEGVQPDGTFFSYQFRN